MRLQGSVSWLISIPATAADDHQDDEVPLAKQLKAKARLHFIFTEKCTKTRGSLCGCFATHKQL